MSQFSLPNIDCRVAERSEIAEDVVSLVLEPVIRRPLPAWRPGAHIDLVLPIGVVRNYSLCGDPADRRRWHISILRERSGRGGSDWIHENIAAGSEILVRGPRNNFALTRAPAYRFIAGGIGITPILPMVRQVEARGDSEWKMLYGGRTRSSMAFLDDVSQFGSKVSLYPQDVAGHPPLAEFLADSPPGTAVFCCGPEGLLNAVETVCADLELELHIERFKAAAADTPNLPFVVQLGQGGKNLEVRADQTLLGALREAGAFVLSSCEIGTCGTCETGVLAGQPDHRDAILTEKERDENRCMYVCVSRASGQDLVLDL
ncbi:PDR/VanB family oxidoreductase [Nocardioides sp. YIM 152315]|uniref:PDR/VanB family oxidoreductase n=1 Tax=Nocardioides sp. YIM 152315 TaxID=3031760 RepID=UPI0023DAB7C6|nr:PDR/VanB family oxidoreductase [Nocardioides sp. YIM 152315]MDF1605851.1 PDR/VanB family oxidoreductase [Nocardioides sp. YIM 152315]